MICDRYCVEVGRQLSSAVQAVEEMLRQQVIAAIGKHIGPSDFAKYMYVHLCIFSDVAAFAYVARWVRSKLIFFLNVL